MRTNQKALQHIYNSKPLDDISDKISDIVVSTYRYNFTVEYVAGKDNELADYLSRNPMWDKESEKHGPWIWIMGQWMNNTQKSSRQSEKIEANPGSKTTVAIPAETSSQFGTDWA